MHASKKVFWPDGIQRSNYQLVEGFLTGEAKEWYVLGKKILEQNFVDGKEQDSLLVDQQGHIRGLYNGLNTTEIQHLIQGIRSLKKQ